MRYLLLVVTIFLSPTLYGFDDTTGGNVLTFQELVEQGAIPGYSGTIFYGINQDVDTGTVPETIWNVGGLYNWNDTGSAIYTDVVSSSAADTGFAIAIVGLDADWLEVTQLVVLNGQTKVPLTTSLTRFNSMLNVSSTTISGSIAVLRSGASITGGAADSDTDIGSLIDDGDNASSNGFYTVPANCIGYLRGGALTSGQGGNKSAIIDTDIYYRPFGGSFIRAGSAAIAAGSSFVFRPAYSGAVPGKTDIDYRATGTTQDNGSISVNISVLLKCN